MGRRLGRECAAGWEPPKSMQRLQSRQGLDACCPYTAVTVLDCRQVSRAHPGTGQLVACDSSSRLSLN